MDWERVFEERLIPLVASVRQPEMLDTCVEAILDTLFRRPNDADNRVQFRALFQQAVARGVTMENKLERASGFLRMVKDVRKGLAEEARQRAEANDPLAKIAAMQMIEPVSSEVPLPPDIKSPAPAAPELKSVAGAPPRITPKPLAPPPGAALVAAASGTGQATPAPLAFDVLFDDTLCRDLRNILQLLAVPIDAKGLPFLAHPAFGEALEHAMRTWILAAMRQTRSISLTLRDTRAWDSEGAVVLLEILHGGEMNNPILTAWDRRWDELTPPAPVAAAKGKPAPKPAPKPSAGASAPASAGKAMWTYFDKHATEHGYVAPTARDLSLLRNLARYHPGKLKRAWTEVSHLYEQEFEPRGFQQRARDGAFRDGLNRWEQKDGLPAHAIEWMAIKAALEFGKLGTAWLRKFTADKGVSNAERARKVPYIMRFLDSQTE